MAVAVAVMSILAGERLTQIMFETFDVPALRVARLSRVLVYAARTLNAKHHSRVSLSPR